LPRLDRQFEAEIVGSNSLLWLLLVFLFLVAPAPTPSYAADSAGGLSAPPSPAIVVGFVGGFVHPDDRRHSEVQLISKLQTGHSGVRSQIFDNHHQKEAYQAILHWLDTDADGSLSPAERNATRIVLFGHSWGAAAVISLARELQRESIPVALTIQVDSITKIGQNDRIVPANVAKAVNFFQTRGMLHGQTKITAEDPARTQILGAFRFDYDAMPVECGNYPWADRHFFKGHTAIECDPHVWSQVENLIESSLSANRPLAGQPVLP
jgi:hypothetical protein